MGSLKLLYVPCKDVDEARSIASDLIDRQLAACGNILPNIESIYRWDGVVQRDPEAVLILKTTGERLLDCRERIRILHSYKIPCILEIKTAGVNADYEQWIKDQTLPP